MKSLSPLGKTSIRRMQERKKKIHRGLESLSRAGLDLVLIVSSVFQMKNWFYAESKFLLDLCKTCVHLGPFGLLSDLPFAVKADCFAP